MSGWSKGRTHVEEEEVTSSCCVELCDEGEVGVHESGVESRGE